MRKGPVGWFIECQCCAREFESKGWAYCPTCMELSADQRRANHPAASDRPCQRPGCPHMIPLRSRADAKYCSEPCARKVQNGRRGTQKASGLSDRTPDLSTPTHDFPQQNQGPRIGPKIWPVNIVGGHRRPNDLTLEAELAATILRCEVGA